MWYAIIVVPLSMGLLGAGHCMAMCGGIVAALSFTSDSDDHRRKYLLVVSYNIGRVFSYSVLGLFAGALSQFASVKVQLSPTLPLLPLVSSILILMLGLYLLGFSFFLTPLERLGARVWRYIQPLSKRFMPIATPVQAFIVGCVWGWLPCGLVYTALAYALTQQSALAGGLVMLCFGLGTLPALIVGGLAGQKFKQSMQSPKLRMFCGLLMLAYGLWSLASLGFGQGHQHHGSDLMPEHSQHTEHSHDSQHSHH